MDETMLDYGFDLLLLKQESSKVEWFSWKKAQTLQALFPSEKQLKWFAGGSLLSGKKLRSTQENYRLGESFRWRKIWVNSKSIWIFSKLWMTTLRTRMLNSLWCRTFWIRLQFSHSIKISIQLYNLYTDGRSRGTVRAKPQKLLPYASSVDNIWQNR